MDKSRDYFHSPLLKCIFVSKVKNILASEPLSVNEEVLKQVIFNIECLKEAKNVKSKKDTACVAAKKGCKCSKCPKCTANKKKK